MKLLNWVIPFFIALTIILIFRGWFVPGVLSNGDWPYLFPRTISEIIPFSTWDVLFGNGIGQNALSKFWIDSYSLTIIKIANFMSWSIYERFVWFFPSVIVSFGASFFLAKKFVDKNLALVSGLIYSTNTYVLLLISGGQVGVMMAYAFLPVVFITFLNLLETVNIRKALIFALTLSVLIIFDLRVGYMFICAQLLFTLINIVFEKGKIFAKILYLLIIPGIVVFSLHFYWILPIILSGRSPVSDFSDIYTSASSLNFFSFAKFENAITLLHPNWPDNIFGKTFFLRPEYLIVPLIAFSSLFWIGNEKKQKRLLLLSFVLLGIIGIFLAKGVNDPFGNFYTIFFNKVPGFVMFRDPTKWYMLIALPFSILIPYSLFKFSEQIKSKIKVKSLIVVLFIIFWVVTIRDVFAGRVDRALVARAVPENYIMLTDRLVNDGQFSRSIWVPSFPTFSYNSNTHPAIAASDFLGATSSSNLVQILKNPQTQTYLQDLSIKYVVVPEDINKNIFVTDRKYDEAVYQKMVNEVSNVKYLKPVGNYGKIKVFEVKNPKEHFWGIGDTIKVSYKYISPTKYLIDIKNAKKGDVVIFTDSYDRLWRAGNLVSMPFKISKRATFNSFVLDKSGAYDLSVFYLPQEWMTKGLLISFLSLMIILFLIFKRKHEN